MLLLKVVVVVVVFRRHIGHWLCWLGLLLLSIVAGNGSARNCSVLLLGHLHARVVGRRRRLVNSGAHSWNRSISSRVSASSSSSSAYHSRLLLDGGGHVGGVGSGLGGGLRGSGRRRLVHLKALLHQVVVEVEGGVELPVEGGQRGVPLALTFQLKKLLGVAIFRLRIRLVEQVQQAVNATFVYFHRGGFDRRGGNRSLRAGTISADKVGGKEALPSVIRALPPVGVAAVRDEDNLTGLEGQLIVLRRLKVVEGADLDRFLRGRRLSWATAGAHLGDVVRQAEGRVQGAAISTSCAVGRGSAGRGGGVQRAGVGVSTVMSTTSTSTSTRLLWSPSATAQSP
ncbi:hypothetical protein TYRP_022628 [Tyrophagus putrescentiae]|nr:hypothetical protein TYRP_022628 [Tyrophagus putrescentiae]